MIISTGLETTKWHARHGNSRNRLSPTKDIILRWRELEGEKWERKERIVEDFRPYLYVNPGHLMVKQQKLKTGWKVLEVPRKVPTHLVRSAIDDYLWDIDVTFENDGAVNSDGDPLLKVYLTNPTDTFRFRRQFTPTYEADVPYEDRYLIDNHETIPEYNMRKLFIDLEALQFIQGESPFDCDRPNDPRDRQEINVVGAYDNFTGQYIQWIQHSNFAEAIIGDEHKFVKPPNPSYDSVMEFDGVQVICKFFLDERSMMQDFVDYVDMVDPDCLLAWGMGFYDLPTLYRRLESLGIGADKLSPSSLGARRNMKAPRYKGHQYRWTEQPIVGRVVISLDRLYERIHRDSQSTNLPSMKLDVVGEVLFGRGKTEFRPDFYDRNYDAFAFNYLYYNFRDVQLMVEIEASANAIEGQQALQRLAPCQFKSTFYGSNYARGYFMRKADFKQRSGWGDAVSNDDWELQGAIVLDPEELNSVGLHKNVVMLDFSGLYPSMMISYNTSWESKVKRGEESDDDIIGDRCRFRREPEGVLPRCVKELDVLRDEYKELRSRYSKDTKEYKKWDAAQKTVKRLRATFYGLMAFQGFAWADIDIARTITYGGRNALTSIMEESEKLGYRVLYGHTDSIMIALGDDKTHEECAKLSVELGEHLTKMMQEQLQSDAVEVEPEILMDRFYLPRRNRYAGRIVWDPSLADPHSIAKLSVDSRIKIQGLEAKHANTAEIGKVAQYEALKLIWDDNTKEKIIGYLKDHIESIRHGKYTLQEMSARARLGKWLPSDIEHPLMKTAATNPDARHDAKDEDDQCYVRLSGNQKGAAWYNVVLSNDDYPPIDKGDSYYFTFVEDGPTWIPSGGYVAYQDANQISQYVLDIDEIIEKNVISKLEHIMYGLGVSNDILRNDSRMDELRLEDFT